MDDIVKVLLDDNKQLNKNVIELLAEVKTIHAKIDEREKNDGRMIKDHLKKMDTLQQQTDQNAAFINKVKGGWKVILAVIAAVSALGNVLGYYITYYLHH